MNKWRFLPLEVRNAYMNMAIDEAILRARIKNLVPNTVRLYRWNPSAVTIGYFQSLELEVDTNATKKMGVDVTRRITGGGAVYHDYNGEITYSTIALIDNRTIPRDLIESYRKICSGIIFALRKFSIEADFRPYNDIIVGNRKISGSAQTRKGNILLQHGTLLIDVDVDTMFTLLKVPNEKIRDKIVQSVKERVTSMKTLLGYKPDFDDVAKSLKKGFEDALEVTLIEDELTEYEKKLADELMKKYSDIKWIGLR